MFHAHNPIVSPQLKSSQTKKITKDNREQGKFVGDLVVPKQHKKYKKTMEVIAQHNKIFDNFVGN